MGTISYQTIPVHRGPTSPTIGADNNVDVYQNKFAGIADEAIADLERALIPLTGADAVKITGAGVEAGDVEDLELSYVAPTSVPTWSYTFPTLKALETYLPPIETLNPNHGVPDPGNAPVNDYNIKTEFTDVSPLDATPPGDAPYTETVTIPDPPPMGTILDPIRHPINIPDGIGRVDIPDFTGTLPLLDGIDVPAFDFTWSEEDYDSAILQATQGRVAELLAGGVGIPEYIWDQIWYRGRDKTVNESARVISEVTNEWSARGFTLPQGAQTAKVQIARKDGFDRASELSRELVIKEAEHEIENLKFAVAQGQSLEALIGGWYQARMGRALDAAKYVYQAQVELFNAQISFFKTQVELFNTEVAKYKVELEAELAVLESDKLYLEGQKLIGDLNEQEIQLYTARLSAYNTELEGYNSKVKGLIAKAQNNAIVMDGYKAKVQAYGSIVQAKTSEYQGLTAEVNAEQMKVNLFESEVKAYSEEVRAYSEKIDAAYKPVEVKQLNNENAYKSFTARLEMHAATIKDTLDTLDAKNKEFTGKSDSYNMKVKNEVTRLDSELKQIDIAIKKADQQTKANIASAGNYTSAAVAEAQLLKDASDALAKAYSQLSASALGAIHVSAGVQDSTSNGSSQGLSFSGGNV